MEAGTPPTTYERAIAAIECADCGPDPDAPSCHKYRLRPSEEAALLANKLQNPPPPWGIKINLSRSFLGPEKCITIGRRLLLSKTLTFLDLSMCDMQEAAAEQFFPCVAKSVSLKHLSVNGNYLHDRGAIAAAPCLLKLESFHCASNGISDRGAAPLAEALRRSSTIKTLSLRNNRITAAGLSAFMEAMMPPVDPVAPSSPAGAPAAASTAVVPDERRLTESSVLLAATSEAFNADSTCVAFKPEEIPMEPLDEQPEEPLFNATLHTLWVDQNPGTSEDILAQLADILSKRYPKPPETKKSKRKS